MGGLPLGLLFLIILSLILVSSSIKILREYERGVIFRLGRLIGAKGPGLIFIIPVVDKLLRISLRTVALEIQPQDVTTRDNISIKVNAVVYFRVIDPNKAVMEVENYLYATSQLAQTTLRSVVGQVKLDELPAHRDKINMQLQDILDRHTEPWGIKVSLVETKQADLAEDIVARSGPQATTAPAPMKLSAVLSITGGSEGPGLRALLTNVGDNPVTIEAVALSLGSGVRTDGIPSGQWRVAGLAMNTNFVVGASRTLAPGQDAMVDIPPSSAKSLHLLAEYLNEDVAIEVTASNGAVAKIDDDAIRATVAQLMEVQDPAVKIRLKRQVVLPKLKPGTAEDSS